MTAAPAAKAGLLVMKNILHRQEQGDRAVVIYTNIEWTTAATATRMLSTDGSGKGPAVAINLVRAAQIFVFNSKLQAGICQLMLMQEMGNLHEVRKR